MKGNIDLAAVKDMAAIHNINLPSFLLLVFLSFK